MHVVPRIMRQPEAFLDSQNAPKSLAAGALPQTLLGELTALPQTPWLDSRGLTSKAPTYKGTGGESRGGQRRARQGMAGFASS